MCVPRTAPEPPLAPPKSDAAPLPAEAQVETADASSSRSDSEQIFCSKEADQELNLNSGVSSSGLQQGDQNPNPACPDLADAPLAYPKTDAAPLPEDLCMFHTPRSADVESSADLILVPPPSSADPIQVRPKVPSQPMVATENTHPVQVPPTVPPQPMMDIENTPQEPVPKHKGSHCSHHEQVRAHLQDPKPAIAAAKATAPKLRLPVKRPPAHLQEAWAAAEAASLPAEAPPAEQQAPQQHPDEDMKDEAPTATSEAPMAISKQPQFAAIPKHMACCIEGPHRANVDTFLRRHGWNRDGTCNCT